MKNILVLAYQLSPTKGSEYSVAWNYVTRMSKYNRLKVIYGVSGEHMGDCSEMEDFIKHNKVENVSFVCVKPDKITNLLNSCNKRGFFRYSFYFAYKAWHKQVYRTVRDIIKKEEFDLIHFVGPIGFREPGFLWKIDLPYMWGPVGGGNKASSILLAKVPLSKKIKFYFRNFMTGLQLRFMPRLRKALSNTDLLLTATTENKEVFKSKFNKDSIYLPENAITSDISLNMEKFGDKIYRFAFVGRLDTGKNVMMLLEALDLMKNKDKIIVDIVGDGPERKMSEEYSNARKLPVKWHGHLQRDKAVKIFDMVHLHIITSANESNTTVIWEAMSHGVPTLSFDHCGMHDIICKRCGILIPIKSREQCVRDLATELDSLINNPERFEIMSRGVLECAEQYTWDKREKFLLDCYEKAIENHAKK